MKDDLIFLKIKMIISYKYMYEDLLNICVNKM